MRTRLALLLPLAALALSVGGCSTASLTAEGAKVAPTRDPLPANCENVGLVSNEDLIEYAMNDLRNKTAELGGTHVRHDPPQLGSGDGDTTTVTITGTAYKCPSAGAAASGVQVIRNF